MKGFSALNRWMAPDAWHRSRTTSAPLGQLAGEIALYQLEHITPFLVENCETCAAGLRDITTKMYLRKPTEISAYP
eukprot:12915567-Prorocentrum_lima.AAC.1